MNGPAGLGGNFQDLGNGEYWIDGVPVDEAEFHRRRDAAFAIVTAQTAQFDQQRQAESDESNRVVDWLRAEAQWNAAHPGPDDPQLIRPSELRTMIAEAVHAALVDLASDLHADETTGTPVADTTAVDEATETGMMPGNGA